MKALLLLPILLLSACGTEQPAPTKPPVPEQVPVSKTDDVTEPTPAPVEAPAKPAEREEVTNKIGELARLLSKVNDRASAKLARPALEALVSDFANLRTGGAIVLPNNVKKYMDLLSRNPEVGPELTNCFDALRNTVQ